MKKQIRKLFEQQASALERIYKKVINPQSEYPNQAKPIFEMLQMYYPILLNCLKDHKIPKTSNAAENLIKEFDLKYRTTMGYSSIEVIREFAKAYLIYLRLCPKSEGNSKGFCPAQIARDKMIPLT